MKRFFLLALMLTQIVFAQEEPTKTKAFTTKHQFFLNLNYHYNFGDNFLSKANSPSFAGIGIQYNMLKLNNFKAGIAYDFMNYKVTDKALGGNLNSTNYNSLALKIQYEQNLNSEWTVEPYTGIGQVMIQQRSNGSGYGSFYGTSYYLGANVTHKLTDRFSVYSGINYNFTSYNVKTAKEFEDFFQRSNQLQFSLGIIFTIPKKP
ncbi:porin family protein [Flavobacterium sp. SM15]|uniref:porin family protein n=1 Tax=Flavobacterium sp. SM15 TaxID=2908005 RepID=UPI001EDA8D0D|nr:porin family protein [Flavobacterium sp. SM15]MCG2612046.1 porin family protein [Flavobacterium sp. SM15]